MSKETNIFRPFDDPPVSTTSLPNSLVELKETPVGSDSFSEKLESILEERNISDERLRGFKGPAAVEAADVLDNVCIPNNRVNF
jgi:hypothetical protein